MMPCFDLEDVSCFVQPFPYFTQKDAISSELSLRTLQWLENTDLWELTEAEFYEQYEFSLHDCYLPKNLNGLKSGATLKYFRKILERKFNTNLRSRVDITVHKLIKGQTIRIHNDFIPGQETHRLLFQLNRSWIEEDGGYLMIFQSPNPESVEGLLPPIHRSAMGFEISQKSYHGVSTVHGGERYTLVYSFYE